MLIAALIAAIGGHWAILQSVAWAGMLADNLQTDGVTGAIARTFDGDHPCRMCKAISEHRQSEKKPDAPDLKLRKVEFATRPEIIVFTPPSLFWVVPSESSLFKVLSRPPPLPPPRPGLA